jgi:hypothetical protein
MSDGCARDHSLFNYFRLTGEQIDDYRRHGHLALGRTLTDVGLAAMRDRGDAFVQRYRDHGPLAQIAEQVGDAHGVTFLTALADLDEPADRVRLVPAGHGEGGDESQATAIAMRAGECLMLHEALRYQCDARCALIMRFGAG